jgi:Calcineurin-like phosphoesterase
MLPLLPLLFLSGIIITMTLTSTVQQGQSIVERFNPLKNFVYASAASSLSGEVKEPTNGFNIAIAGDWGCSNSSRETAENIEDKEPELVLVPGDLSYEATPNCWYEIISPFAPKTKIAIGNHDDKEDGYRENRIQYMDLFNLTQSFYSFNYRNIHVLVMDTQLPFDVDSAQYDFVKGDLYITSMDANTDWVFVMFHKPMYSSPAEHVASTSLRDTYHPLFDAYGVDLVIQAHNHMYERTFPLDYNEENTSEPIANRTYSYMNSSFFARPSDPIFAVVGTGGRDLHNLEEGHPYVAYNNDQDHGFLNIDITDNGKMLTGKFYANGGNTTNGNAGIIKDQFVISRENISPKQMTGAGALVPVFDIKKAKQFIKNQYDPNVKLVKESSSLDRFWLWTDNVLAVKVLSGFDSQLAQSINQTINQAKSQYKLEMRHPIAELVDRPQDFSTKPSTEPQISANPDVRYSDYTSGKTDLACNEYADIGFLKAIHLFNLGDPIFGKTCYDQAASTFDGTGLNDSPKKSNPRGFYALYKMILWKIAQDITGFRSNDPPQPFTDNLIANAQDSDGGIRTDYKTIDSISGLTNVETTALAIMAYEKEDGMARPPVNISAQPATSETTTNFAAD